MPKKPANQKPAAKKAAPKRLGRGLTALIGSADNLGEVPLEAKAQPPAANGSNPQMAYVDVAHIVANPWQPRQNFDAAALSALADSLKSSGMMQPVVLRHAKPKGLYELIAGERRWRAAKMAKLTNIPAVIRDVKDREVALLALVENLQREDLNALEQARALQRLTDEFNLTHAEVAEQTSQSRSAVTNFLRLLDLAPAVQNMLAENKLQMAHCRALLAAPHDEQARLARRIVAEQWSVRELEEWFKAERGDAALAKKAKAGGKRQDVDTKHLERALADQLGATVSIKQFASGRGNIVVHYHDLDSLEGVLDRMGIKR